MLGTFNEFGSLDPRNPNFVKEFIKRMNEQKNLAAKRLYSIIENNGFIQTWNIMPYPPKIKAKILNAAIEMFIESEEYEKCAFLRDEINKFVKRYPEFTEDFKEVTTLKKE